MGLTIAEREHRAFAQILSEFGFSDTDDVPLSAVLRSALQSMRAEIQRLAAVPPRQEPDKPRCQKVCEVNAAYGPACGKPCQFVEGHTGRCECGCLNWAAGAVTPHQETPAEKDWHKLYDEVAFLLNGVDDALNGSPSEFQRSFSIVRRVDDVVQELEQLRAALAAVPPRQEPDK